jgi:hypothetical protein
MRITMTLPSVDIKVTIDFELDREFLAKIESIAISQEWQLEDTILNLARHALGTYQDEGYDRADMELIIKGVPID